MTDVQMDEFETRFAEKHGLKVSENGDRYVVTDPQNKKRYEGGNLYVLMLNAVDERKPKEKPVKSNVIKHNFEPTVSPEVVEKIVKDIKHGKVYRIKVLVLDNPNISNSEICDTLKSEGTPSPMTTIVSVRNDFVSTINLLKKMGRYKVT